MHIDVGGIRNAEQAPATPGLARNYGDAKLREVFVKQLNNAIALHAKVFNFMYERGWYPAYNLNQLLANDVKNANKAINL